MSGDKVVVGAPYKYNDKGAAYVFVRRGTTWSPWLRLPVNVRFPNPDAVDEFGYSVSISGETAIIGAPGADTVGDRNSEGAAYVYVRSNGTWTEQGWLTSSDTSAFGYSVGISGNAAIIVPYPGNAAYISTRSGTTWSAPELLLPNLGEAKTGEGYGESVAISGNTAIVGAFRGPCTTAQFYPCKYRGSAYVFVLSGGAWIEQKKLE